MKPALIALMGICLCGCEMYPEQNAERGKLLFPSDPKNIPPAPIEPIESPTASGTKAKAGDPRAQYDFAASYHLGEGIGRDDVAAYKWYTIAAANSSAGEKLKARVAFNKTTLARRMPRGKIDEAEKAERIYLYVSGAEPNPAAQSETNEPSGGDSAIPLTGTNIAIIASVNPHLGFVVLNAGSDNGLKAGQQYNVLHDGKLVGRVEIKRTQATVSIAVPTESYAKAPLQRGDKVMGITTL